MHKKTLIIQGGGFRTCFSTGVLDAFRSHNYNPFDSYVAVSGGAIALSYFLSQQYRSCYDAMCFLANDKDFMRYNRLLSAKGIMNVDSFMDVALEKVPFNLDAAMNELMGKKMSIVMTNRRNGRAEYHQPNRKTWLDAVIASCTLPFVTKGKHMLNGEDFMDGGWSDPIPVEWAYNNGATDITVIRTSPVEMKMAQTWPDYFGTLVFRSNAKLKSCFENNHHKYNKAIDFLNNPPKELKIEQIGPEGPLQTGTYSNSVKLISADYRYGMECGLNYIHKKRNLHKCR